MSIKIGKLMFLEMAKEKLVFNHPRFINFGFKDHLYILKILKKHQSQLPVQDE